MSLLSQIGACSMSFLFGFTFFWIWTFLNRLFKNFRPHILFLLIELPFFLSMTFIYHRFLLLIVNGINNIFYFLFLFLGGYVFHHFYERYFLNYLEKKSTYLHLKIFHPIQLKISSFFLILKKKKEKRKTRKKEHGKKQKKQNKTH